MTIRRMIPLALAAGLFVIGACSPMPGTGTTTTTTTTTSASWIPAGCLSGGNTAQSQPDLFFNGTPNQRGNAVFFLTYANGSLGLSGDGTCTGLPVGSITIVRAASQSAADALCASLNSGAPATSFTGSPWSLPADGWSCSDIIQL